MDLVLTSLEAWDGVWRRNQHLVAGLLRRHPNLRVLFVEPATDPMHAALKVTRPRLGRGLRSGPQLSGIRPGQLWLYEPTKWLPRRFDPSVDQRWARQVMRATRALDLEDPVLWVNDPSGAVLLEATGWPGLYDVTDDWTVADRTPAETVRVLAQERVLLERADEVVVCSPALVASKGGHRHVTLVANGVDTASYLKPHSRPADLPEGPLALYVGTLHADRLDIELCAGTVTAMEKRGRLVLVGPDALRPNERTQLERAGVVLLGARSSETVPAYLLHADVLVVPHVVTAFTESLDPIKLYEYAAAGRPVVSTPVAGFRDADDPRVIVASGNAFIDAVLARLPRMGGPVVPPTSEVSLAVHQFDWSHRVDQMSAVLARADGSGRDDKGRAS
jgi:glycosyltransferase involved in cell wall biosynthesis